MYELEQNVFDGPRAVMETLRVSQYDFVLFNMDTQRSISFLSRLLAHRICEHLAAPSCLSIVKERFYDDHQPSRVFEASDCSWIERIERSGAP